MKTRTPVKKKVAKRPVGTIDWKAQFHEAQETFSTYRKAALAENGQLRKTLKAQDAKLREIYALASNTTGAPTATPLEAVQKLAEEHKANVALLAKVEAKVEEMAAKVERAAALGVTADMDDADAAVADVVNESQAGGNDSDLGTAKD